MVWCGRIEDGFVCIMHSISRDERDSPKMCYITNAEIYHATIMHFKHHHRVICLISNGMSV